jgi:hypothetical protein
MPSSNSFYGIASPGVISAHTVVQPNGQGVDPTLSMTFPSTTGMQSFVINLGDLSDPLHPNVDINTMAFDPNSPNTAKCGVFGCSVSTNFTSN